MDRRDIDPDEMAELLDEVDAPLMPTWQESIRALATRGATEDLTEREKREVKAARDLQRAAAQDDPRGEADR